MAKIFTLDEMLDLSPHQFSNQFFVRKVSPKPPWNKGLKMPDAVRQKISAGQKGKTVSETTRLRMARAQKGKFVSEKTRLNLSKSRKGKVGLLGDNPRARAVICPAGTFDTIKEGAIAMGCDGGTMRSRIKKGLDGYYWAPKKQKN
jgi:hypothetical protein